MIEMVEASIARVTSVLSMLISLIPTTTSTIPPPTTTPAPTTSTTVNEATFAPTTAPPAAADFLKNLFDKTTTISPAPEDPLIAIWNALTGVQDRGDPITAVVGELTLSGDRHNCFGLFDGIVDSK